MALLLAPRVFGEELLVFGAASTQDGLTELAREFSEKTGVRVDLSCGGSSLLARQIAAGAPADVFLSADERSMDVVQKAGKLVSGTRHVLLTNRLVVVVPSGAPTQLKEPKELRQFQRIALANPQSVPAGLYARDWLTREGLWDELSSRVIPALDVRAALASVTAGAADAAIVYQTDANVSARVKVIYRVPLERTPPIRYVMARLTHAQGAPADAFLRFLEGERGRAVFVRLGFVRVSAP